MAYFTDDFHRAPDLIADVKDALSTMTLLFEDATDMGTSDKRGATVILNCLREVLALAERKAKQDHDISYEHKKIYEELKKEIKAAHAEGYKSGRTAGFEKAVDMYEKMNAKPILNPSLMAAEQTDDGVYPHIDPPMTELGEPAALSA